jgi:AraC-like DNA-binding protein
LRETDDQAEFVYMRPDPMYFTRPGVELALARTVTTLKMFGGHDFQLISAHFQYSAPQYVSEYRRIFGNELWFGDMENKLVFPSDILHQPIPSAQPYLRDMLLTRAEKLLRDIGEQAGLKQQVQNAIINGLPSGAISIDQITASFNMSRQTLYRKLKDEGTSFQKILEDIRKSLAADYLQHTEYAVTEIAFLLGFSELSSFHRAFKRWYGTNPKKYRSTLN